MIKKAKSRPHTAAIGDGGNDVSMIQEAHAGIGIIGKEGRQAAINSDFAIAKFKFLKKALFVHGHWYYIRTANLTQYFFYKNLILMIPQFIFSIFCGFSTQSFFDALYLMSYNVIFTSFPIMMYGLFEQNYSADTLLRKPYLYRLNQGNCLLSMQQLFLWIFLGSWHAIVIFFMPYTYILINPVTLYNNTPIEQWTFSILVFHLVTLIANLQILLRSSYWTIPLILVVLFSQLIFVAFAVTHSFIPIRYDGDMLRVFIILVSSITFWLLTIVVVVTCLIPDYLLLTYNNYRSTFKLRKNEESWRFINSDNDNTQNR